MIKPLETYVCRDKYGNIYGTDCPSQCEMFEKVNEIIDYLNSKENDKEDENKTI